jgi:acetylornithine deacetylase
MAQHLTARQILEILVGFPTVSRDSNLELVDWVETYLQGFGVSATRVYNPEGTKAALYANVGPDIAGGVVFSGHTDVVPVDDQDWSSDPFVVSERDGKLFGRGTTDMKGFDSIALAAVPLALERGVKRPLQIALSYDEELGCTGAPPMIEEMAKHLPRAEAAIIGEPTTMQVVTGHKGSAGYDVQITGYEMHSSLMHLGVNAIMEAAKIIDWGNQQNAQSRAKTPGPLDAPFDPPWTTLHTGQITGGTAHNITAGDCRFDFDFRCVPGDDLETWRVALFAKLAQVEAQMKAVNSTAAITANRRFQIPALTPEIDGAAERLARRLSGDNATHVVSYGTEAGQFQERGYSAVVCGPGDIAMAHQADEYISVEQFEAGQKFAAKVVDYLCE